MGDLYFKATDANRATHGGRYTYRRNRWTRVEKIHPCRSGWHLARNEQVLDWLTPTLWLAEYDPEYGLVDAGDKVVAGRIRLIERLDTWNDCTARLFAADCAEAALALIDNPDPRSVEAVAVARRFANGEARPVELSAARLAADAVRDAPAASLHAARAAMAASLHASRAAARAASLHAADAAWSAAWVARRAADAAADAAAKAAADAAAWDAADAARQEQYANLLTYLLPLGRRGRRAMGD